MIKNETTNLVSQVQCQRWGSWGEMHSMWKDKVRVWFLQGSNCWPRGFSWRSRPGLISLLTHQCTLTHCLRCNSGCRRWRGWSIGGRKVIIVWHHFFKFQSFSSYTSACQICLLLMIIAIIINNYHWIYLLMTAMLLTKYWTLTQPVAGDQNLIFQDLIHATL